VSGTTVGQGTTLVNRPCGNTDGGEVILKRGDKMIEIEGAKIIGVTANLLKQTVKVTIESPVSEGTMDLADKLRLIAQAEVLLVVTLSKLQPELPFEQTVEDDGPQMSIPGLVVINGR
jgi:hypothetical protein